MFFRTNCVKKLLKYLARFQPPKTILTFLDFYIVSNKINKYKRNKIYVSAIYKIFRSLMACRAGMVGIVISLHSDYKVPSLIPGSAEI